MKLINTIVHENGLRLLQSVRDSKFNEIADYVGYVHVTKGNDRKAFEAHTAAAFDAVCLIRLMDRLIAGAEDIDETENPF